MDFDFGWGDVNIRARIGLFDEPDDWFTGGSLDGADVLHPLEPKNLDALIYGALRQLQKRGWIVHRRSVACLHGGNKREASEVVEDHRNARICSQVYATWSSVRYGWIGKLKTSAETRSVADRSHDGVNCLYGVW